ncbi:arsenic transport integral membrane protein ArsB [Epidermidibacterium keratini]
MLLVAAAIVIVATGALPLAETDSVLARIAPVLGFLLVLTALADVCDEVGLFAAAAAYVAYAARGRPRMLFAMWCAVAIVTTWFLSLDTTAVMLTPVAIGIARQTGARVLPFALACVWLANSASLLLPVSNLTNLLAVQALPAGQSFLALSAAPQIAVLVVVVGALLVLHSRTRAQPYEVQRPAPAGDRLSMAAAAVAAVGTGVAASAGAPAWLAGLVALCALWAVLAVRGQAPDPLAIAKRIPVVMAIATTALLIVVAAAAYALSPLIDQLAVEGNGFGELLGLAGASAASANLLNNIPVYVAFEPLASTPHPLLALLVGVNAGPLVLLWASLANLLWWRTCRSHGVTVPLVRVGVLGAVVAVLSVLAGTAAIWAMA